MRKISYRKAQEIVAARDSIIVTFLAREERFECESLGQLSRVVDWACERGCEHLAQFWEIQDGQ